MPDDVSRLDGGFIDAGETGRSGLAAFHKAEIAPWLATLRGRYRARILSVLLSFGCCVAATLTLFVFIPGSGIQIQGFPGVATTAILFICVVVAGRITGKRFASLVKLHEDVQETLQTRIAQFFGESFDRSASDFPFSLFVGDSVVPQNRDWELTERIAGQHDQLSFVSCEARLALSDRSEPWVVFEGTLIVCEAHKSFTGTTLIKRNAAPIGFLFPAPDLIERVYLEDPRFENLHTVFATDQVEARYLLTPTFMERFSTLSESLGKDSTDAAFMKGKLLLALSRKEDPDRTLDAFLSVDSPRRMELAIQKFELPRRVIDMLHLNAKTVA